jgi:hypothetical protein
MNLGEAKQFCTLLYYTATMEHNVDDRQWMVLLDVMNKKYWNDIVRAIGSIYQMDTPDLYTDGYGQLDYNGSVFSDNDLAPNQVNDLSIAGGWTNAGLVLRSPATIGPNGVLSSWELKADATSGTHQLVMPNIEPGYQGGLGFHTIYAKAGGARYIYLSNGTSTQWYDLLNGVLASSTGSPVGCYISPSSQPGFGYSVNTTSSPSPVLSQTGWYKCLYGPETNGQTTAMTIGISVTDGAASFTNNGADVYVWGPRRSYVDNMVDCQGVHMPTAVELKYFGRYIKLDYEIPQDRYIYNIAFGQVQVLIPSAWTLMNEKIILLPRVSNKQVVRMSYIPRLADLFSDNQQLLAGKLPTYHSLLAYEVVAGMLPKDADRPSIIGPLMDLRSQLKNYLQTRQRQDGRKIRFVPYE